MKMKRILEKDTRTAMEKVKHLLSKDAIILSNKRLGSQVEIIAAVDLDEEEYYAKKDERKPIPTSSEESGLEYSPGQKVFVPQCEGESTTSFPETLDSIENTMISRMSKENIDNLLKSGRPVATETSLFCPPKADIKIEDQEAVNKMGAELTLLRAMFEEHLDIKIKQSRSALGVEVRDLMKELSLLGISETLVDQIQQRIRRIGAKGDLWRRSKEWLAQRIVLSDIDINATGGIYALVGTSGVGKTTSLAKIASQFALVHGRENIALVTIDQNRIGAKEHLVVFGMMLGIEVHHVSEKISLEQLLIKLQKKLVLIDTVSNNPHDNSIEQMVDIIKTAEPRAKVLLTIAANVETETNKALCTRLEQHIDAVIATKIDEAQSIGGLISTIVESRAHLLMISDGQGVPEDLKRKTGFQLLQLLKPRAKEKVNLAMKPGQTLGEDLGNKANIINVQNRFQ